MRAKQVYSSSSIPLQKRYGYYIYVAHMDTAEIFFKCERRELGFQEPEV
jgi:hypothetical protein